VCIGPPSASEGGSGKDVLSRRGGDREMPMTSSRRLERLGCGFGGSGAGAACELGAACGLGAVGGLGDADGLEACAGASRGGRSGTGMCFCLPTSLIS
jgi:hypothetical protein